MLATPGQLPEGEGWAQEMKWDGQRAITRVKAGSSRLFNRNGNDVTATFPGRAVGRPPHATPTDWELAFDVQ